MKYKLHCKMQVVNGYTEIEDFATVTSLFLMNCANRTVYMCVYHTNITMLNSFMQWFETKKGEFGSIVHFNKVSIVL